MKFYGFYVLAHVCVHCKYMIVCLALSSVFNGNHVGWFVSSLLCLLLLFLYLDGGGVFAHVTLIEKQCPSTDKDEKLLSLPLKRRASVISLFDDDNEMCAIFVFALYLDTIQPHWSDTALAKRKMSKNKTDAKANTTKMVNEANYRWAAKSENKFV